MGERRVFSINDDRTDYSQRKNGTGSSSPYIKISARYITDLNIRCKIISILEDKTGIYLNDLTVNILKIH